MLFEETSVQLSLGDSESLISLNNEEKKILTQNLLQKRVKINQSKGKLYSHTFNMTFWIFIPCGWHGSLASWLSPLTISGPVFLGQEKRSEGIKRLHWELATGIG